MSDNLPTAYIPLGHTRFRVREYEPDKFDIIFCTSNKHLEPGVYPNGEAKDDQEIKPAYAIRFDSLEHVKGYANSLTKLCELITKRKEKENESRNTES